MTAYDPEKEIPDSFWSLIESADQSDEKLSGILQKMDKEKVIQNFSFVTDAGVELIDKINWNEYDSKEFPVVSEDVQQDVVDWIITQGKDIYLKTYKGEVKLPLRETWDKLTGIFHVFSGVYFERFDEEIWDEIN